MTAFLLKSLFYKRNCSKLKNIIAFLLGSSETINGYIFTSHHYLGSCKKWVKESTMWGQRRKRIKANDKFSWFRKDTLFRLSNLLYSLLSYVLKVFQKTDLAMKSSFLFLGSFAFLFRRRRRRYREHISLLGATSDNRIISLQQEYLNGIKYFVANF